MFLFFYDEELCKDYSKYLISCPLEIMQRESEYTDIDIICMLYYLYVLKMAFVSYKDLSWWLYVYESWEMHNFSTKCIQSFSLQNKEWIKRNCFFLCSPRLHLLWQKYSKNSNIITIKKNSFFIFI